MKQNPGFIIASQICSPLALPAYSLNLMPSMANGMHSPKKEPCIPKAAVNYGAQA